MNFCRCAMLTYHVDDQLHLGPLADLAQEERPLAHNFQHGHRLITQRSVACSACSRVCALQAGILRPCDHLRTVSCPRFIAQARTSCQEYQLAFLYWLLAARNRCLQVTSASAANGFCDLLRGAGVDSGDINVAFACAFAVVGPSHVGLLKLHRRRTSIMCDQLQQGCITRGTF